MARVGLGAILRRSPGAAAAALAMTAIGLLSWAGDFAISASLHFAGVAAIQLSEVIAVGRAMRGRAPAKGSGPGVKVTQ